MGIFGSTITWGGATNLREDLGNAVEFVEITSLSGVDHRNAIAAIPEPAAVLLWLAGWAALGSTVRMRRMA